MSEIQNLGNKYISSRKNILIVMAFTVINIILMVLNANMYFLFSATMPQVFYMFGSYFGEVANSSIFLIIGIVLALVVIGLYALGFILSKKNFNWMTFLAVFFALDIAFLAFYIYLSGGMAVIADFLLDILFHVFIMISLVSGVINASKLKKKGISAKDVFSPEFMKIPLQTITPDEQTKEALQLDADSTTSEENAEETICESSSNNIEE